MPQPLAPSDAGLQKASSLRALPLRDRYRTGQDDLVADFYVPCLRAASRYDRAVGFFRSSVIHVSGAALVAFARRRGTVRLVCSPELTREDVEAIRSGYDTRAVTHAAIEREVERVLADLDLRERTVALATLVSVGALDVRIAFRTSGTNLYHEKLGIFADAAGNEVSFRGSSNETWSGWDPDGNGEAFDVFCSWRAGDERRVEGHRADFERLWKGGDEGVTTEPFPDVALDRLRLVAAESLDALPAPSPPPKPPRSNKRSPFPHQAQALAAWHANGRRGIFEHATGSGKTFTALLAIREHVEAGDPCVVLVPSDLLLEQWAGEVRREIPDAVVLKVGGGNSSWKKKGRLRAVTSPGGTAPRVVIATLQTAYKPAFVEQVASGDHLLLVADEVHKAGSREYSRVFGIDAGTRLGLSATPRRYGDPEGTAAILNYFDGVVPPPFTLADALSATPPRLVPYDYHPHRVRLRSDEAERHQALTEQIRLEYARRASGVPDGEPVPLTDRLKYLLIERARVVKKAAAKVDLASEVLSSFVEGQRWLVYCEDTEQLRSVLRRLTEDGLPAQEYHTQMTGDAAGTLDWFRTYGGVLVSIRCLDEGVDIPQTTHALILASSQNPREFIQRRGRVLRIAPEAFEKYHAVIHDALVVPDFDEEASGGLSIARTELRRAAEFARTARNDVAAESAILAFALDAGLRLDDENEAAFEDDPTDDPPTDDSI